VRDQVITAVEEGPTTAITINADPVGEDVHDAVDDLEESHHA
jgi:hypothetical protein